MKNNTTQIPQKPQKPQRLLALLAAVLLPLTAAAQINIGGNVFGGARQADVKGHTFVDIGAQYHDVIINGVYGGNDIAGTIGTSSTTPFTPVETIDNSYNSYVRTNREDEGKHLFMEVAYKLGFCYNELGLYKQAFYYLDLIASDGNIRHTMELVNAMANGKDLRLFNYTEEIMDEVKRNFDQDDLPENIKDFINFLRRRRGYAYIDFNQLDQAEKVFTQMLGEEDNADYAINELAYIKKLRQQRGEDMTASSDDTPSIGDITKSNEPPF